VRRRGRLRRGLGDNFLNNHTEDQMPTFMLSLNWTDQGIRKVKDASKRNKAAKELAKKVGIEIKQVYLTSGDDDLLLIVDTPSGDNVFGERANEVMPRSISPTSRTPIGVNSTPNGGATACMAASWPVPSPRACTHKRVAIAVLRRAG
jgi:uncharacterized protein with GYD domain